MRYVEDLKRAREGQRREYVCKQCTQINWCVWLYIYIYIYIGWQGLEREREREREVKSIIKIVKRERGV